MSRPVLARALEPIVATLWAFFLAWSVLLALVWVGGMDAAWAKEHIQNAGLQSAVKALLNTALPCWLALAVVNLHLSYARSEGLRTARTWLLLIMGGALVFAFVVMRVGLPARIYFLSTLTAQGTPAASGPLGPHLLGIPLGWMLLWALLVIGAREMILWLRPRASHAVAASTGTGLVLLSFLNIHLLPYGGPWPWWFWFQGTINDAAMPSWFGLAAVAFGLSWLLRETRMGQSSGARSRKPAIAFLVFNLLLIIAQLRFKFAPPEITTIEL